VPDLIERFTSKKEDGITDEAAVEIAFPEEE